MCYSWLMLRQWVYCDEELIRREFAEIPAKDRAKLMAVMEHYRTVGLGNPSPAQIDVYGGGIRRLRHIKPAYQGRLLFFVADRAAEIERLVVLTVFKKQSQDVPKYVLDRAEARKVQFERRGN